MQVRVERLPLGVHHLDIELLQGVQEAFECQLHALGDGFHGLVFNRCGLQRALQVVDDRQQVPGELFEGELARLLHILLCPALDVLGVCLGAQGGVAGGGQFLLQSRDGLCQGLPGRGLRARLIFASAVLRRVTTSGGVTSPSRPGISRFDGRFGPWPGLSLLVLLLFVLGLGLLLLGHARSPLSGVQVWDDTRPHPVGGPCADLSRRYGVRQGVFQGRAGKDFR